MFALMRRRANLPIVTVDLGDRNLVFVFEQFFQTTTFGPVLRTRCRAPFACATLLRPRLAIRACSLISTRRLLRKE